MTIWRCDLTPQYFAYKAEIDQAIQEVLCSGRYTLGPVLAQFEREFAAYHGTQCCLGVANGTDALTLALKAYDIGPGDEVITTPYTAIPTCSAIVASGARPVFVDIDPETFLIDLDKVKAAITPRTRAIMPVHIFGNVVDIPRLRQIVGPNMPIIEDACQAHGSTRNGQKAGTMGDMGVFSFYPTKNVGGYGDGGAIITSSKEAYDKLKLLHHFGMIDKDTIVVHGVNSRLDELQAAILRVKLRHLDEMNAARQRLAARYVAELNPALYEHQKLDAGVTSNFHVYVCKVRGDRDKLVRFLDERQIQTNIYYVIPLHLQKANDYLGYKRGDLPVAEQLCDNIIAIPMYPELEDATLSTIINAMNAFAD